MSEKKLDQFPFSREEPFLFWSTLQLFKKKGSGHSLRNLMDYIAVRIFACRRDLVVPDTELQEAADCFRYSLGLKTAADTNAFLTHLGLEMAELEFLLESELLYHKLWQSICSVDSVQEIFARNKQVFEVVRLAGLYFDTRHEAEEFYERLIEGKTLFPASASDQSVDSPTEKTAVHIGYVTRADLPEEAMIRVFSDDASEFVGPVEDESGFWIYHILLPKRVEINENVYGLCEKLLVDEFLRKNQVEILGQIFHE